MGIHVGIHTAPERIAGEAWRAVYRDSLRVVAAYRPGALGLAYRQVAAERVVAYTRLVVRSGQGWCVCGDASSKLTAEQFELPEEYGAAEQHASNLGEPNDLLLRLEQDRPHPHLFGNKTQGLPFHVLIVAIATLVENRFPTAALAYGDLSLRDGTDACKLLEEVLGETFLLPIVLDAARLGQRLSALVGPARVAGTLSSILPPPHDPLLADVLGILQSRQGSRLLRELERARACTDAASLEPAVRDALTRAAGSLHTLSRRLELGAGESLGREALLGMIARGTTANCLRLTEDAWDTIDVEPLDVLRFLATVSVAKADELALHHISRALLESAAVRQFAIRQIR